jgi:hypothetical protein
VGRLLTLAAGSSGVVDGSLAAEGFVTLLLVSSGVAVLWIGWHLGTGPWQVPQLPAAVSERSQSR